MGRSQRHLTPPALSCTSVKHAIARRQLLPPFAIIAVMLVALIRLVGWWVGLAGWLALRSCRERPANSAFMLPSSCRIVCSARRFMPCVFPCHAGRKHRKWLGGVPHPTSRHVRPPIRFGHAHTRIS